MLNQRKILRVLQLISYLQQGPAKTVIQLAEMLETTERTAYRYLDLIRECGFDLTRDKNNRFIIHHGKLQGARFTNEEAEYLKQLILTAGKRNKLKDAVLGKIYMASDVNIVAGHLVNAKNGRVVERLAQAIAIKEQVILKRYHSINSETISDRLVEPFGFTDNYHTVMAFEIKTGINKTYHLDRITAVEFHNKPFVHEDQHQQQIPDAFGFSNNGKQHRIEVDLPLKAYLLLKDEYPLTVPYIKYNTKKDCYELRITVNNLKPFERFMRGLREAEGGDSAVHKKVSPNYHSSSIKKRK
jgi:predicted DNA-binding transcriptional regulator YafY